jgi:hypothetical protein
MHVLGQADVVCEPARGRIVRADGVSDEPLIHAIALGARVVRGVGERSRLLAKRRRRVTDQEVSRIVEIAFLAPDVVETMLNGEKAADVTVKSLTIVRVLPVL